MIELDGDTYILGFWFAHDIPGNDCMACVVKQKGEDVFKGWSRFRDRKDDKFANSDDVKRWTAFTCKPEHTEEDIIKALGQMQSFITIRYPYPDKLIIKGDMSKMVELAPQKDWLQMRKFEVIPGGKK